MKTHIQRIVGAYYRKPADTILSLLPLETALILRNDPYGTRCNADHDDPNAISVWIDTEQIQQLPYEAKEAVEEACLNCGTDISYITGEDYFHLGYIPKVSAAKIILPADDHPATFTVLPSGAPAITWEQ